MLSYIACGSLIRSVCSIEVVTHGNMLEHSTYWIDFRKLHLAVVNRDVRAVQYVVAAAYSQGLSHLLDIRDTQHGHTVLHLAVCVNRPSFVRLLVVAGASPNVRSRRGETPLLLACARRQPGCISSMMRPVDDSERQQLTNYCLDVGLPLDQLQSPPIYSTPDTNLLDFNGTFSFHFQAYGAICQNTTPLSLN